MNKWTPETNRQDFAGDIKKNHRQRTKCYVISTIVTGRQQSQADFETYPCGCPYTSDPL